MSENVLELQMLIRAAQRGDESAFETLLSRFETPIYRYVYSILGNRTDAEDVTQEVFIKLWRTLPRYRFDASFYTYLTKMARNAAHDCLRSRAKHARVLSLDSADDPDSDPLPMPDTDPQNHPAQAYLDAEKSEMLQKALLSLPEDMREIVTLRAIGCHDYTEIAAILSIPQGTVKSRLHRARNFLIKILESGNFFE